MYWKENRRLRILLLVHVFYVVYRLPSLSRELSTLVTCVAFHRKTNFLCEPILRIDFCDVYIFNTFQAGRTYPASHMGPVEEQWGRSGNLILLRLPPFPFFPDSSCVSGRGAMGELGEPYSLTAPPFPLFPRIVLHFRLSSSRLSCPILFGPGLLGRVP